MATVSVRVDEMTSDRECVATVPAPCTCDDRHCRPGSDTLPGMSHANAGHPGWIVAGATAGAQSGVTHRDDIANEDRVGNIEGRGNRRLRSTGTTQSGLGAQEESCGDQHRPVSGRETRRSSRLGLGSPTSHLRLPTS